MEGTANSVGEGKLKRETWAGSWGPGGPPVKQEGKGRGQDGHKGRRWDSWVGPDGCMRDN